jgi:hypothetical protein
MPGVDADPFGHDEADLDAEGHEGHEGHEVHAGRHGEHDELAG